MLLAVIEGVGIGFQRMLAGSTKLEVNSTGPQVSHDRRQWLINCSLTGTASGRRESARIRKHDDGRLNESPFCRLSDIPLNSFSPTPLQGRDVYFSTHYMTVGVKGGGAICNIDAGWSSWPYKGRAEKPTANTSKQNNICLWNRSPSGQPSPYYHFYSNTVNPLRFG